MPERSAARPSTSASGTNVRCAGMRAWRGRGYGSRRSRRMSDHPPDPERRSCASTPGWRRWNGGLGVRRSIYRLDPVFAPASGRFRRRCRAAAPDLRSDLHLRTEAHPLLGAPTSSVDRIAPIAELRQNRSRPPQKPSFRSASTLPRASLNACAKLSCSATFANAKAIRSACRPRSRSAFSPLRRELD
jgi:hypothetical protein